MYTYLLCDNKVFTGYTALQPWGLFCPFKSLLHSQRNSTTFCIEMLTADIYEGWPYLFWCYIQPGHHYHIEGRTCLTTNGNWWQEIFYGIVFQNPACYSCHPKPFDGEHRESKSGGIHTIVYINGGVEQNSTNTSALHGTLDQW